MNTKISEITIGQILAAGFIWYIVIPAPVAVVGLHFILKAVCGRGIFALIGDWLGGRL